MTRLAFAAIVAALPAVALADDTELDTKERTVVYAERTELEFEGLDVEGSLVKPAGVSVSVRRIGEFNPMIRVRTDFNVELEESLDFMK